VLELGAEGSPTAEAGDPRDAGVVQLGVQPVITTLIRATWRRSDLLQLGRELVQQSGPYLRAVRVLNNRHRAL